MLLDDIKEDALRRMVAAYDADLRDNPDDPFTLLAKGMVLNKMRRRGEGFECLDEAVATARKRLKDAAGALRAAAPAAEPAADGPGSHAEDLRFLKGEVAAARNDLREISEEAHISKGMAVNRAGRHAGALSHYKAALKLNPRNGVTHYLAGCALDDMKKHSKSVKHFGRALRLGYREQRVHCRRARALNAGGMKYDAILYLRRVTKTHPDYADAHYELATLYATMKEYDWAIRCYQRAIDADPRHKKAHEYMGISHMARYRDELARPYLERALELAPGDPDVLEMIGMLEDRGGAARPHLEGAPEPAPGDPDAPYMIGPPGDRSGAGDRRADGA